MHLKSILSLALVVPLLGALTPNSLAQSGNARKMSLQDCFKAALEQNYNIEIGDKVSLGLSADLDISSSGRIGFEMARINLHQDYAAYEPEFVGVFGKSYERRAGGIDPTSGLLLPGNASWQQTYRGAFQGRLASGATYELFTSMGRFSQEDAQYNTTAGVSLTQPLLRGAWGYGGTEMGIKLRKIELKVTEYRFALLVMDTIRKVADAYYDLAAARGEVKVQEKALELAQQLVQENKKKVEVGNLAPLEERQAESQAASAKAKLSQAIFTAQSAELTLKSLLTRDYSKTQSDVIDPEDKLVAVYQNLNLVEAWRTALERRPDYQQEIKNLEKDRIGLTFAKNQVLPSLDLSATYQRNGLGGTEIDSYDTISDNRFPDYGGFITLRIPLTFRKERDNMKLAKLAIKSGLIAFKQKEDAVIQEVDLAHKSVRSAYEQTQSNREARVFAEEALEAERKKLENGKSTSFQVLQFQKDLTTASSAEVKAIADYNKALNDFYFREGTILDRNKIVLELK